MNINLTFQSQDYQFIVEAIKLRTTAILEAMSTQYDFQIREEVLKKTEELNQWSIRKEGNGYVATMSPEPEKTQEVKAETVTKRKTKAAPFGYKKDGTPKKRPGRPVGI